MRWITLVLVLAAFTTEASAACRGGRCGIVKKSTTATKRIVTAPVRVLRHR